MAGRDVPPEVCPVLMANGFIDYTTKCNDEKKYHGIATICSMTWEREKFDAYSGVLKDRILTYSNEIPRRFGETILCRGDRIDLGKLNMQPVQGGGA